MVRLKITIMELKQYLKLTKKSLAQFCRENGLNYDTMRVALCRHDPMSPKRAELIEEATGGASNENGTALSETTEKASAIFMPSRSGQIECRCSIEPLVS